MKTIRILFSLLSLASGSSLSATLVVHWNGSTDYVTTSRDLARRASGTQSTGDFDADGSQDDRRYLVSYSESVAMNPAIGANYSGSSAQFFGSFDDRAFNATINLNLDDAHIEQNTAGDRIGLRIQNSETGSTGGQAFGLYTWLQGDFLNGASTGTWSLNSVSLSVLDNAYTLRWIVKNNGQWYISQETETGANATHSWASSGAQWSAYTPTSSIVFDAGSATFNPLAMTDIEGVGIYFQLLNTGTTAQRLRITNFQVEAVPEPSTVALLLGFAALGLVLLRRRARRG